MAVCQPSNARLGSDNLVELQGCDEYVPGITAFFRRGIARGIAEALPNAAQTQSRNVDARNNIPYRDC